VRSPGELKAFVAADGMIFDVYRVTSEFPSEEKYALTSQIRRAVVSISSNLAEGCSRSSQADFARFVEIALGSVMELQHQLSVARRLGFGHAETLTRLEARADELGRMLNGLGRSLRAKT
jgi:four helix bundle protein